MAATGATNAFAVAMKFIFPPNWCDGPHIPVPLVVYAPSFVVHMLVPLLWLFFIMPSFDGGLTGILLGYYYEEPDFTYMGFCLLWISTCRTTSNQRLSSSRSNIRKLASWLRFKMFVWSTYLFLQCLRLGEKFQNPLACCIGPLTLQIMDLVQYGEDCEWNKHYNTSTRTQRRVSANPGAPLGRRSKTKRKRSQANYKQSSSPTSSPAPRTPTTKRRGRTKKRK